MREYREVYERETRKIMYDICDTYKTDKRKLFTLYKAKAAFMINEILPYCKKHRIPFDDFLEMMPAKLSDRIVMLRYRHKMLMFQSITYEEFMEENNGNDWIGISCKDAYKVYCEYMRRVRFSDISYMDDFLEITGYYKYKMYIDKMRRAKVMLEI